MEITDPKNHLKRHTFNFSPLANGGESLLFTTDFYDNGDHDKNGVYSNQEITLMSYCNCANIRLFGIQVTPELLRKLAYELEQNEIQAINAMKNRSKHNGKR